MTLLGTEHASTFLRSKEALFTELGLDAAPSGTVLDAIVSHPELLERPIVVHGGRALIARPPERLLDLL